MRASTVAHLALRPFDLDFLSLFGLCLFLDHAQKRIAPSLQLLRTATLEKPVEAEYWEFRNVLLDAFKMLQTCEQLAAGLGASPTKNPATDTPIAVGNARLGLWVGRKFLGK